MPEHESIRAKNQRRAPLYALIGAVGGIVGVNVIGFDHPAAQGIFIAALVASGIAIVTISSARQSRRTVSADTETAART